MAARKKKPKKRTLAFDTHYRSELHRIRNNLRLGWHLLKRAKMREVYKKARLAAFDRVFADIEKALEEDG
jgi:hypothetical protein